MKYAVVFLIRKYVEIEAEDEGQAELLGVQTFPEDERYNIVGARIEKADEYDPYMEQIRHFDDVEYYEGGK